MMSGYDSTALAAFFSSAQSEMEPPFKRPRLSILSDSAPPDANLNRARRRNDLGLKSRFEAIFDKYAHDFTDIGDEIDLETGEVVINNGHLQHMEDEKDTGALVPPGPVPAPAHRIGNVNGGSLLRAMTVAPEDHTPDYDDLVDQDVIMSIENMAQNAAEFSADEEYGSGGDEGEQQEQEQEGFQYGHEVDGGSSASSSGPLEVSDDDTDDELFERPKTPAELFDKRDQIPDEEQDVVIKEEEPWDEEDLTFHADKDRSSSPDSLFDNQDTPPSPAALQPESDGLEDGRELSDDAILNKFGPRIGPQVLNVIEQRRAAQDAHIEPAWRVPDIPMTFRKPTTVSPPLDVDIAPSYPSPSGASLWRPPPVQSYSETLDPPARDESQARDKPQARDESEDPLQEDFSSPPRQLAESFQDDVDDVDDLNETTLEVSLDDMHEGICPFCRKKYTSKNSVWVHWDDLLKQSHRRDFVHDMKFIREYRSHKRPRSQFPKVTVEDLHAMVKLHEVDKMDWKEMNRRQLFEGRPTSSLQSIYYQYRTVSKTDEQLEAEGRGWTIDEDEKMLGYCEDITITLQDLGRKMKGRTQAELGNRLSSIWMQQYQDEGVPLVDPKWKSKRKIERRRKSQHDELSLEEDDAFEQTFEQEGSVRSEDSMFKSDEEELGLGPQESEEGLLR